jgi:EAL domain-containing protein (putative c-di-GMP-specific phosphodiesterase class I)
LKSVFAAPFSPDGSDHTVSATIGLARLSEVDGGGSDALKSANIALSRAKDGQRGEHCYFTREMELDTRNRVRLLRDLRVAFEHDRLYVVYQPQVSLDTRRVLGVEALLRWRNELGQFVPPNQFIPLAENSGMIVSLGEWVLRSACLALRQFNRNGLVGLRMAVNVSVSQFRHPSFLNRVDLVLEESGIDPKLLELEITESIAMLDSDFMVGMIEQLKQRGILVAIDDFGTGFSSLSYLERLNVDRLKIDRSFVSQMSQGASSQRIVETIVQLGRTLDMDVIAEGVESEDEATMLAAMGCHEAQGYLYAKPMEIDDVIRHIQAANK